MRGILSLSALCAISLLSDPQMALAQDKPVEVVEAAPDFDAQTSWEEFEGLLRGAYAYIDRADIDVDAQLERSEELAVAAGDADTFRLIIHQTALTFMDPHLIVGPFTDDDYAIVMSAADMDLGFEGERAIVRDVRRASPAFEAGIRPGDVVIAIDGDGLVPGLCH